MQTHQLLEKNFYFCIFKQKYLKIAIEKYKILYSYSMHHFYSGLMNAVLRQKKWQL